MQGDTDITKVASLMADPARAKILLALGDNRALAASVLADEAGVAASTASSHLKKLVDGGFLTVERHGRHRYFRLAGPHVAQLLEALARVAPPAPVKSLKEGTRAQAVRLARTCYDHLAGEAGPAVRAGLGRRLPAHRERDRRPRGLRGTSGRAAVATPALALLNRLERAAPPPCGRPRCGDRG